MRRRKIVERSRNRLRGEAIVLAKHIAADRHDARSAREVIRCFAGVEPVAAIEVQLHDRPEVTVERAGGTYALIMRGKRTDQ